MKKIILSSAIMITLTSGVSNNASATLALDATLDFFDGIGACLEGAGGTYPNCNFNATTAYTSYFSLDFNGDGKLDPQERIVMESANPGAGITLGTDQARGAIDLPWTVSGQPGQHYTSDGDGLTVASASGNTAYIDMSGLNIWWGDSAAGTDGQIPVHPYNALSYASITCGLDCTTGDTFVLDYKAFTGCTGWTCIDYELHLEGVIGAVPIPPTILLFSSGLFCLFSLLSLNNKPKIT